MEPEGVYCLGVNLDAKLNLSALTSDLCKCLARITILMQQLNDFTSLSFVFVHTMIFLVVVNVLYIYKKLPQYSMTVSFARFKLVLEKLKKSKPFYPMEE